MHVHSCALPTRNCGSEANMRNCDPRRRHRGTRGRLGPGRTGPSGLAIRVSAGAPLLDATHTQRGDGSCSQRSRTREGLGRRSWGRSRVTHRQDWSPQICRIPRSPGEGGEARWRGRGAANEHPGTFLRLQELFDWLLARACPHPPLAAQTRDRREEGVGSGAGWEVHPRGGRHSGACRFLKGRSAFGNRRRSLARDRVCDLRVSGGRVVEGKRGPRPGRGDSGRAWWWLVTGLLFQRLLRTSAVQCPACCVQKTGQK